MADTEQTNNKIQVGAKIEPDLFAVLEHFRNDEGRSMSNMIERLLKTHPRVAAVLEAEPALASAK